MDDVSLGHRHRGFEAVFVPDAVAGHASVNRRSDFAVYHGHRNIVWGFFKNTPVGLGPLFLIPHILQTLLAFLVCIPRGQARVFLRAKTDAWQGLGREIAKRRAGFGF